MLAILLFLFYSAGDHSDPHSFPTRRSSDLRASEGTSRPEKRRLPDEVPNSRSGSAPRRAWSTTTPGIGNLIWEPSLFWPTRALGRPKIGRASCRERVWVAVVAG